MRLLGFINLNVYLFRLKIILIKVVILIQITSVSMALFPLIQQHLFFAHLTIYANIQMTAIVTTPIHRLLRYPDGLFQA